jgi:hypothetical protein
MVHRNRDLRGLTKVRSHAVCLPTNPLLTIRCDPLVPVREVYRTFAGLLGDGYYEHVDILMYDMLLFKQFLGREGMRLRSQLQVHFKVPLRHTSTFLASACSSISVVLTRWGARSLDLG